jgi:hypothetical protein
MILNAFDWSQSLSRARILAAISYPKAVCVTRVTARTPDYLQSRADGSARLSEREMEKRACGDLQASGRGVGYQLAMRLQLFILGVLAAVLCMKGPARAAPSYPWCAYYNTTGGDGNPRCWFATLKQCVADVWPIGGNCSPNPNPPLPKKPKRR